MGNLYISNFWMRINSNNTNPGRACVKHNHARIMKSSKTQKINNYRSTPVLLAPQLKQFATGSSKMITRQKAEDERAKEIDGNSENGSPQNRRYSYPLRTQ